jgi:surfeit locus 1 family protein
VIRRLPVIPTIIVLAAVAVMIRLGFWQYERAGEKAQAIAVYGQAQSRADQVPFPRIDSEREAALYRRSSVLCEQVVEMSAIAATAADGRKGWGQIAQCRLDGGGEAEIMLGWMQEPKLAAWQGGRVEGIVAPAGHAVRLLADPPQAGLVELARPDPNSLPNNHMAYMGQWFFFAITALVIYALAVRGRLAHKENGG